MYPFSSTMKPDPEPDGEVCWKGFGGVPRVMTVTTEGLTAATTAGTVIALLLAWSEPPSDRACVASNGAAVRQTAARTAAQEIRLMESRRLIVITAVPPCRINSCSALPHSLTIEPKSKDTQPRLTNGGGRLG